MAREVLPADRWANETPAGRVSLTFDDRYRRRFRLVTDGGEEVMLDLPQAQVLCDGDALRLLDGRLIAVSAASEPLMEARAASSALLMRLAWHIGNRHLAARLEADRILLRRDHVIAEMLRGLGAEVTDVTAPFDPEGGAYGSSGPSAGNHHHDPHGAGADE